MNPTLEPDELVKLTGYRQAARQLAELRRMGFTRARRAPVTGQVILERPHYEAVSAGRESAAAGVSSGPQPAWRRAA